MNWQALNPLRWAIATKNGAGALWEKRPRLTKRRVAWGLAASMLAGGGGLYGYQKFKPGRRPAATAAKPAADQSVQPIPDTAGADPNSLGADPNALAASPVDPNSVDPNSVDPNSVDPNSVDPNSLDPNASASPVVDPSAAAGNAAGTMAVNPQTGVAMAGDPNTGDPNTGDPNAGDPNTGDPNTGDPNAGDPNAGDPGVADPNAIAGQSPETNGEGTLATTAMSGNEGVANNAAGGQPAAYAAGEGPAGAAEAAVVVEPADTASSGGTVGQADDSASGAPPVSSGGNASGRARNSLRGGLTAAGSASAEPAIAVPSGPPVADPAMSDLSASNPSGSNPNAPDPSGSNQTAVPSSPPAPTAPVDLMPVPQRPQPSPPEEHVRLPPEAAPNLSPENAVRGGGAASAPRPGLPQFGGGSPTLMAPPAAPPYTPPTAGNSGNSNPGSSNQGASSGVATGRSTSIPSPNSPFPNSPSASSSFPSSPSPNSPSASSSFPSNLGPGAAVAGSPSASEPGVLPDMGGVPIVSSPMPGAKSLEGPQVPMLELQKLAPEEVKVGKPARFEIKVKNIGRVAAQHIVVIDQIPRGTKFLEASPPCNRGVDGVLRWQVGALGPGQETTLVLQLLPEQEGEIGSVAQVIFHSQAAVRTVSTQPRVSIEHQVAERVLIGDQVKLTLAVANRGSGATTNLVLEATLPESLGHPAGAELEYPIGVLRPNETRRIELSLRAQRPGAAACQFIAREESQPLAEDRVTLDVLAPQLQVGVAGPKVRYLDRQATYSVSVANPGTAAATNLEVTAYLPRGLKFLSAENQGQYDPQRHAVLWGLAELPAGVMGASQLVVVPAEPGEQRIRVEGKADLRLEHAFEQPVLVETLSEIQFSVADTADPIEVGSETTYEIKLQNRGSRAASQVRVAVEFPAELAPSGGDGPTAVAVRGQQLLIDPLQRLAPSAQATYRIRARGSAKGDPRIRVLVASEESPTPVTKEESTRVYSDE